jgi:hypothetical protein
MARTRKQVNVNGRLEMPAGLSKEVAEVFDFMVRYQSPDHFAMTDTPILVEYCRATVLANQAAAALGVDGPITPMGKASPWLVVQEKAQRALVALSARLRLCPQSRFDRLKAGTSARTSNHRKPWELTPEEEEARARSLDEFRIGDDGLPVNRSKKLWER